MNKKEKRVVGNLQKLFFGVLMFFILVGMGGCGGSSSSSTSSTTSNEGYTITGTIVNGSYTKTFGGFYKVLFPEAFATDSTGFPNQIDAVSDNGTLLKTFPIDTDGSFTIDTGKIPYSGAIFFVVDNTTGYVFGNLRFATNKDGIYLDYIPFSDMDSDIDMGYLSIDNLTGPNMETCGAFKENQIQNLNVLAEIDNAYTLYGNNLENKGIKCTMEAQYIYCTYTFADLTQFDNYTSLVTKEACSYALIQPILQYKPPYPLKDNSSETFTLLPPDNTSVGCWSFSYNNAWCNLDNGSQESGVNIGEKGMSAKSYYNSKTGYLINFPAIYGKIPSGKWILKNSENAILGSFSFDGIRNFNQCSYDMYFVPHIKLNYDEDKYLTSMYIQWYVYKDGKEQPIDKDYFYNFADNLEVSYDSDYSYGHYAMTLQSIIDNGTTFVFVPDKNHKLPLSSNYTSKDIDIFYSIGPIKYHFGLDTCGGIL